MTHLKFFFVAALCVTVFCNIVYGQGCSDAGFCTINGFKPNGANTSDTVLSQVKVGVFSGKADHRISVFGGYLEYNRRLNSKFGLDTKLTTMAQIGNNISAFGLGDIYVNANFKASDRILFTLGTKLPLTKADKTKDERPLPMDYQSSLGTIDVIFGIGYTISKLQLVAAIQHPITQNNNQFIAENYPSESPLSGFQSTNKFERSGDVLLRVSYPISLHSKFVFTPSILPIYHLKNDSYTDASDVEQEIKGSQGLTLNGNVYLDYYPRSNSAFQLNLGLPFVVRDVRPDGLTRSVIANLEYRFKF